MLFERILEEARKNLIKDTLYPKDPKCLHLSCPSCNGTGINKVTGGGCIHGISCSCKFCRTYA